MNALSLQSLYLVDPIAEARMRAADWQMGGIGGVLGQLDPATRREVMQRGAEWGVMQGLADLRAAGVHGLGQDYIALAVERALKPMLPGLQSQLMAVIEPAAKKAADTVGPVLEEKLRKWGPILAIIAGAIAAALGIVGMLVVGGFVVRKVA